VTKTLMNRSCPPFLSPPADKAIAAPPAATVSHCCRQPPSQRQRQSRASAARFCPLIFCRGGGGGADDNNNWTPLSTSTRSFSAAVAAKDGPTQWPRWQRRQQTAANRINNQQMTRSGGAGRLQGDDTTRDEECTMHTTKQIIRKGG
jgi:hypothetical protein